jgi:hypothetical protein
MFGRRTEHNPPAMLVTPTWGPDTNSRRMTGLNLLWSNPVSPASVGIGLRPAPAGASATEGTKSTTWFQPLQNFRGFVAKTTDPTLKNTAAAASLPAAQTQINPVIAMLGRKPGGF